VRAGKIPVEKGRSLPAPSRRRETSSRKKKKKELHSDKKMRKRCEPHQGKKLFFALGNGQKKGDRRSPPTVGRSKLQRTGKVVNR